MGGHKCDSTMNVSMNLIVSPSDSVIVNMSVNINLNVSSGFGMIWYTNINMRMIFKVNPS